MQLIYITLVYRKGENALLRGFTRNCVLFFKRKDECLPSLRDGNYSKYSILS